MGVEGKGEEERVGITSSSSVAMKKFLVFFKREKREESRCSRPS
jgi:hypothetical protein